MKIAVGNSRMDKKWKNKNISWDDFMARCKSTIRTTETVSEYRKMSKPQQDAAKDVGGFVAGVLKEGKRKNGFVEARTMVTLDLDHAEVGVWDHITMFCDNKCLLYSTHKHMPDAPRVRLILPLKREVTAEEYPAISRMIAKQLGVMEMTDDTCHEPARLMYWPSTSSDGEFLFESQDGDEIDPDEVLSLYKDWHDTTQWPMSSRQSEITKRTIAKQADPLEKKGIVGVFCRTYDIDAAISTFLSDIYKPSAMEGRYDFIEADSTAGVVVYDGKFAYSFHATDPASGKLMNSFDLVRAHKFLQLDDKAKPDTAPTKFPSYKAMIEFALTDDNVKLQLAKDRELSAEEDFLEDDTNWQTRLEIDKEGGVKDTLTNYMLILRHDPHLLEIKYNEHRCGIDIRDTELVPWVPLKAGWADSDMAALAAYIDRTYHIFNMTKLKQALLAAASERSFHPIKEYLEGLPEWDGTKRVDDLLITWLGAEDSTYTKAVTRKMLVAAIARVYSPGIKFDQILVLAGEQGVGKSTLFGRLGGSWFSDSLSISDMKNGKDASEKLQGYWILEIAELNGIRKVEVETVKSFASRQDDKYRAAYGTVVESHPRQCVIFGTTNTLGFLRDATGNRRFWPVQVTGNVSKHPFYMDRAYVDQVWAEALSFYNAGEELTLAPEEAEEALKKQRESLEVDDREGLVRAYLEKLLPSDWSKLSLSERRTFLAGEDFGPAREGTVKRDRVCNLELWAECFGKDPASIKKQDSYELSSIMNKIEGWKKYEGNKSGKLSFGEYGAQLAYVRAEES